MGGEQTTLGYAFARIFNAVKGELSLKRHSCDERINGKWRAEIATLTAFSCSYRNVNQVEMQPVLCDIIPWVDVILLTREG